MRTPYDAVIQAKYNKLMKLIEKYNLLDLWDEMIADESDLTTLQLCNLAEALINKNTVLKEF